MSQGPTPIRRQWASQQEAAVHYGVTDRTIRNMIRRGEITGYRLGTRLVRVDLNELDQLRPIPAAKAG